MATRRTDLNREAIAKQMLKVQQTAVEFHTLADEVHRKAEQLHGEAIASHERARSMRKAAQARTTRHPKKQAAKPRQGKRKSR
jgi:uncharacterized coiled-coil DUF342 family protein